MARKHSSDKRHFFETTELIKNDRLVLDSRAIRDSSIKGLAVKVQELEHSLETEQKSSNPDTAKIQRIQNKIAQMKNLVDKYTGR